MDEKACQKVVWSHVPMREIDLEKINQVLSEGYEIVDIIPDLDMSGGGMQGHRRGLFTSNILFQLSRSQRKAQLSFYYVGRDRKLEFVDKINEIIKQENDKERSLIKIIQGTIIREPVDGSDLGEGTKAFFLFFIGF